MTRKKSNLLTKDRNTIRCAIYTRKSTEEGLEQEFNTLDAQRESGEAFIASQQHEGWVCLPDCYDDGGFTGGNMERPALQRLMVDIEAGRVDCVVVYKVDRLSRSLLDFARMMETFEKHHISFVSVTQQFNTSNSMGRLMLNVLLSFAQFEREIISERTRDKIAATRRKGKWSGGKPLLGYDVVDTKLIVNQDEAERVREIFSWYLEHKALVPVVQELNRRGWTTKHWTTRKELSYGGKPFTKNRLYRILTNVAYIGKVRYKKEVHAGEHEAIIDPEVFQRVQGLLQKNGRSGGQTVRNKSGALLRGRLRCKACNCAMTHSFTVKDRRRYRYYVCVKAQQRGWKTCPAPSIPADEIEKFVVEQIQEIGHDPEVIREVIQQASRQSKEGLSRLEKERAGLEEQRNHLDQEMRKLTVRGVLNKSATEHLADLQEQLQITERRLGEIHGEVLLLSRQEITREEVTRALAGFAALWDTLSPREQSRILELLIERVDYDGQASKVAITFRPMGIKALGNETQTEEEEAA